MNDHLRSGVAIFKFDYPAKEGVIQLSRSSLHQRDNHLNIISHQLRLIAKELSARLHGYHYHKIIRQGDPGNKIAKYPARSYMIQSMDERLENNLPHWQSTKPRSPVQQQQDQVQQGQRISDRTSQENEISPQGEDNNRSQLSSNDDKSDIEREQQAETSDIINDDSKPKRNPFCSRCRNHGKIARVKGHKRHCEFKVCQCDGCKLVEFRQIVSAAQIKRRRYLKQDEECGRQIEVTPPVLERSPDAVDPAALIAKSLTGTCPGSHMKHIPNHIVRPTAQQLLSNGKRLQLHNHQPDEQHLQQHIDRNQGMTQARLKSELAAPMSVAAMAAATTSSHQSNARLNPLPFLEAIANHALQSHSSEAYQNLQKYHQINHETASIAQDSKSILKLHPLSDLANHHHHHLSQQPDEHQSAATSPTTSTLTATGPSKRTSVGGSSGQTNTASIANYHLSSMLNQCEPMITNRTTSNGNSSSTSIVTTLANSSANSSSSSSSNTGSINQLPPTPTSANPTPMTSASVSSYQMNNLNNTNGITNDSKNHAHSSTHVNSLLIPTQREKLQIVYELYQRYGPLIVYSWLNSENFDVRKILYVIENAQTSFNELINLISRNHLADNNSGNGSSASASVNHDMCTNINNNMSQTDGNSIMNNNNITQTSNHHHHHHIQNQRNPFSNHPTGQQQDKPHQNHHEQHHHEQHHHEQHQHQHQHQHHPNRLPINYGSHSSIVPHFIDHILAHNNRNQLRSAHYNIGSLLHNDHYQLLNNHLHNNPSQMQMDITQALLNTTSSSSSMSTIL